jgi:hypothetical protein
MWIPSGQIRERRPEVSKFDNDYGLEIDIWNSLR